MSEKKDSASPGDKSPKIVTRKHLKFKLPKFKFWNFSKLKSLNRNAVLIASLVAVLLLAGVFSLVFSSNTKEIVMVDKPAERIVEIETAPAMIAVLSYQDGITEYKTDGEWTNAPKDLEVVAGMSLRSTGAASRAVVELIDGSEVRLGANTEVTFETMTTTRIVVAQNDGHIFNRIIPSSSRSYIVQTENAQFQSLGTSFKTTANGDEESAEVYQGSIREASIDKSADEGKKLTVKNFKDPAKDGTVEELKIEELKKDNFVIWNRDRDEQNDKFKDKLGFLSDIEGPKISITSPKLGSTIELTSNATEGTVQIEGTTEKGVNLTVQSKSITDSKPVDVAVTSDGTFKTPVLKAVIGSSLFTFIAKDNTGNETTLSITLLFKKKNIVQKQGIALTLDNTSDPGELVFNWGLVGMTTPDGVQLVYSETNDPIYPDNLTLDYISTAGTKTIPISDPPFTNGTTYYFKVCRYTTSTDSCDTYSNEVSALIPPTP